MLGAYILGAEGECVNLRGAALPCQAMLLPHEEGRRWLLGHLPAENQAQCSWGGTTQVGGKSMSSSWGSVFGLGWGWGGFNRGSQGSLAS